MLCSRWNNKVTAEIIQFLGKNEVSIFGFDSDEEFMEELANA